MARNYGQYLRGEGVWVPRWLMLLILAALALWFASRIFMPPMWVVQQLDAPSSERSARLLRSVYIRHHFVVKLKEGWTWQTVYYSPPIPGDLRIDLGERLRWSEDSTRVWLYVEGLRVWGYDVERQQRLAPDEMEEKESEWKP